MQNPAPIQNSEASKHDDISSKISHAQTKTWEAVDDIARAIFPGMTESEAKKTALQVLGRMGVRKFWHKCHVRFGAGTSLGFGDPYSDNVLDENDIFYVDIGPIWDGIEGDAGTTFVVGKNETYERCRDDAKAIFLKVQERWRIDQLTGIELYHYAEEQAAERGWILAPSYVRGHRLSEFPHSFYTKLHVDELDFAPLPNRWVLEIQICDPDLRFGAFYEDTLQLAK